MEKPEFSVAMARLRACYPSLLRLDKQSWQSTQRAFYDKIRHYDDRVILRAMDRAVDVYPKYLPTVGQINELCQEAKRELARVERLDRQLKPIGDEDDPLTDPEIAKAKISKIVGELTKKMGGR